MSIEIDILCKLHVIVFNQTKQSFTSKLGYLSCTVLQWTVVVWVRACTYTHMINGLRLVVVDWYTQRVCCSAPCIRPHTLARTLAITFCNLLPRDVLYWPSRRQNNIMDGLALPRWLRVWPSLTCLVCGYVFLIFILTRLKEHLF